MNLNCSVLTMLLPTVAFDVGMHTKYVGLFSCTAHRVIDVIHVNRGFIYGYY